MEASVGSGGVNKAFELGNVRERLVASGHLKDPNAGLGAALTSAIRGFQADMGLKPDGLIEPGGETEELLIDREGEV